MKKDRFEIDDMMIGIEMGLMTQEQVVSEFHDLAQKDFGEAALRYPEFAEKLDQTASGGNAQIRSLQGGPDTLCRAALIDIMASNYTSASNDVKEMIRDEAVRPLLKDNFFYVQMAIARMSNPHLVGDIVREYPLANPRFAYYEDDLVKTGALRSTRKLQQWFDKLSGNMFAATTIALQRKHEEVVNEVVINNEPTFQNAAHIVAATHDIFAEGKIRKGADEPKHELTQKYRTGFVDVFAAMVEQKDLQASWLPPGKNFELLY